jgi:type IV secretory pathway TraG/TraD family ATPase VirD4
MLAGQQGVALAAPPRAGKGTGVVVPNALNWPGSLVCVDIKRENWTITAGFRAGRLADDTRRVREADRDVGEMEPCLHRGPG